MKRRWLVLGVYAGMLLALAVFVLVSVFDLHPVRTSIVVGVLALAAWPWDRHRRNGGR